MRKAHADRPAILPIRWPTSGERPTGLCKRAFDGLPLDPESLQGATTKLERELHLADHRLVRAVFLKELTVLVAVRPGENRRGLAHIPSVLEGSSSCHPLGDAQNEQLCCAKVRALSSTAARLGV